MRAMIAAVAVSVISTSAYAADQISADPAPAAAPAAYDWTGFYVGAHGGWGFASLGGVFDNGGAPGGPYNLNALDPDGFLGGVHAGYNWQWNQYVFGLEADVSGTDIEATAIGAPSAGQTININVEVDLLASIRARAGYAVNNVLFYGTVGAGYAEYDFTSTFTPLIGTGSVSDDDWGVVFGGGLEYGWGNWLFRGEVLHYDVTPSRAFFDGEIPDADDGDFVDYDGVTTIRAGVSYKF